MNQATIYEDIAFLTEGLVSPIEQRIVLRSSLEAALFRLGYTAQEIDCALDSYYNGMRMLH